MVAVTTERCGIFDTKSAHSNDVTSGPQPALIPHPKDFSKAVTLSRFIRHVAAPCHVAGVVVSAGDICALTRHVNPPRVRQRRSDIVEEYHSIIG
jgi:hypothetical protein